MLQFEQFDWDLIVPKHFPSCFGTIGYKRRLRQNYKNLYSKDHVDFLKHLENLSIATESGTPIEYNDNTPWTIANAKSQEAYAIHYIDNDAFKNGTYRIIKPGVYILNQDIEFNPNPENGSMPTEEQKQNGDYPTKKTEEDIANNVEKETGYFHMGFFAAITIECEDVVLNLNGKILQQSRQHMLEQRFFACVELASAPFIHKPGGSQGPSNFAGTPVRFGTNVIVTNGKLGRSSHHAIHGNNNVNILVENITIFNFEVAAIHLNAAENCIIRDVHVSNAAIESKISARYSQGKFLLPFLHKIKALDQRFSKTTSINIAGTNLTVTNVINNLEKEMNKVLNAVKNNTDLPSSIFVNESGLADGNRYGIVLNSRGVAVANFLTRRFENSGNVNNIIHSVDIENIETKVDEILACSSITASTQNINEPYGGGRVVDAVGSVLRIFDSKNADGTYKSNILTNGQLLLKSARNSYTEEQFNSGTMNIPQSLIDWAAGNNNINNIITGKSNEHYYVGLGDVMGHHVKGDIGLFIQGAKDAKIFDINICNMNNNADMGKAYMLNDSEPYPGNGEYLGANTNGIVISSCDDVSIYNNNIFNLKSENGIVNGINLVGEVHNIRILDNKITDLKCSGHLKYIARYLEGPNKTQTTNKINIDNVDMSEISIQ